MQMAMDYGKDEWTGWGVSLAIHVLLFTLITIPLFKPEKGKTVILTVETVSGYTPLGSGTGVEGNASSMSNQPANLNPLAQGLKLKMDEAALPLKAKSSPKVPPVQSAASQAAEREKLKIGINPREGRASDEPSEGGMGNNQPAGTEDGIPGLKEAFGGRGYAAVDMSYPGNLPEETEGRYLLVVSPRGEVVEARVVRTTTYSFLDEHVLARLRNIRFTSLGASAPQENQQGEVTVRFEYTGSFRMQ